MEVLVTRGERPKIPGGGAKGIQYLVSLQWPVVQLDFSDGMHMTENSDMPQQGKTLGWDGHSIDSATDQ